MIEFRLRTKVSEEELAEKRGKVLTEEDFNVQLTRACRVRKPDGSLLAIYLPGAIPEDLRKAVWPDLSAIRAQTVNRGLASGTVKTKRRNYSQARSVASTVVGAMDPYPRTPFCRLTAYTAKHVEAWSAIRPLFVHVAGLFAEHVPDRFRNQMDVVARTQPEWVIPGTPFSTITVNNTYPTGVHTDKGDLDEGFSCLVVLRQGAMDGGHLVFPEYRVAVQLQDRDLLLMDAHEWHGNVRLSCSNCGDWLREPGHDCKEGGLERPPERVSIVHYFRTRVAECGTAVEEEEKGRAYRESALDPSADVNAVRT